MKKIFSDINGKALLYAIPLFLTPFVDKMGDLMYNSFWPTYPQIVISAVVGIVQASVGLRAYYDGSYERSKTNEKRD